MNNKTLTRVALRYHAVFLDINRENIHMMSEASVPVNMKGYVCRKGSQEKIVCPNGYGNDGPNSCLEIPELFLP